MIKGYRDDRVILEPTHLSNGELNPAVQWLERDYEFMGLYVSPQFVSSGLSTTVLIDLRDGAWWGPEQGGSVGAIQEMFTIKDDRASLGSADAYWDASEGPVLPYEEFQSPVFADSTRTDSYRLGMIGWYVRAQIPVPKGLTSKTGLPDGV